MFNVEFKKSVAKTLNTFDQQTKIMLMSWINKNLCHCDDPRFSGKPLKGQFKGLWRYKIGNYRIIAQIIEHKVTIIIIDIDHRKDIYKK